MTTAALMSKDEIISFLDQYRANETDGVALFGGWATTCKSAPLRGALRVMESREHAHALLLEKRLRELGGEPKCVPQYRDVLDKMCSAAMSDAEKLVEFVRIAPPDKIVADLTAKIERMSADPETQSLVRSIIEDERATLYSMQSFRDAMTGAAASAA
jgi:hypothetical protein